VGFDGTLRASTFKTGGWYVLGSPVIAALGVAFGAFVATLARRRRQVMAGFMLALALTLFFDALRSSLPANRVSAIIGERAARNVTIERLRVADSFNEGATTWGIISGPNDLVDLISRRRGLTLSSETSLRPLQAAFPDDFIPDVGDAYCDQRALFFRHPATGKIYFRKR
jgi:hypothetical protein